MIILAVTLATLGAARLYHHVTPSQPGDLAELPYYVQSYCAFASSEIDQYHYVKNRMPKPIDDYSMVMIHAEIVVRHGARMPLRENVCWRTLSKRDMADTIFRTSLSKEFSYLESYDDSPADEVFNSWSDGELLEEGAMQEYLNGKIIYDWYMTANDLQKLFVRHTDINRTRVSAANLLAGIANNMAQKDATQFSLHTSNMRGDTLLSARCPRSKAIHQEIEQSRDMIELKTKYSKVEEKFLRQANLANISKLHSIKFDFDAVDCHLTQVCRSRTIYDQYFNPTLQKDSYRALVDIDTLPFFFDNASLSKVIIKSYLKELITRGSMNLNGLDSSKLPSETTQTETPNLYISVAHDSTLGYLLSSLGGEELWKQATMGVTTELLMIPYASYISFEFYQSGSSNATSVRVLFNGQTLTPWIYGCESYTELCPLDAFIAELATWDVFSSAEAHAKDCELPTAWQIVHE